MREGGRNAKMRVRLRAMGRGNTAFFCGSAVCERLQGGFERGVRTLGGDHHSNVAHRSLNLGRSHAKSLPRMECFFISSLKLCSSIKRRP